MASVKISVNELTAQKAAYTTAAKNVRDVLVTVKNARSMIGSDKMFEGTRQTLGKMAERLEKRADALEMLAKLIDNAANSYKSAQKNNISVIYDMKAHKTDFYGTPVYVSAATVGAVGAAAITAETSGAQTVNITQNYYTTNVSTPSTPAAPEVSAVQPAAFSGDVPVSAEIADSPAPAAAEQPAVIEPYDSAGSVILATETAVVTDDAQYAEPAVETSGIAAAAAEPAVSPAAPDIQDISEPDNTPGIVGASIVGGGAALGAAAVGASDVISGKYKAGAQKRKIDKQLMEARRKMTEIESEEAQLKASLSSNGSEE